MRDYLKIRATLCVACLVIPVLGCGEPKDRTGGGSSGAEAASEEANPPSVILISLDTLRYDHCGFNGYERDTTPFLDSLAKDSIVFDRAYTTMSWTLIAHMSMVSGLYPNQHGVTTAFAALSSEFPTLAERLDKIGYVNFGVQCAGWLHPRFGFGRGFTSYASGGNAEGVERALVEPISALRPEWPYFLFLHLFDIHSAGLGPQNSTIYSPPAPYDEIFVEGARSKLAGVSAKDWWNEPADPTPEQHEAIVALYDGGIRYVDSKLKKWFEDWQARGLLDNTVIIITSDHGEGLRDRYRRYGGHGDFFEHGLKVPLLVHLPGGHRGGERVGSVVSLVDIVPTVMELVQLDPDKRLPGQSLLGEGRGDDEWVFASRKDARVAIRSDAKIMYSGTRPSQYYDLKSDPHEKVNFKKEFGQAAFHAKAQPLLDDAIEQLMGYPQPPPPDEVGRMESEARQKLKALGYGGEVEDKR